MKKLKLIGLFSSVLLALLLVAAGWTLGVGAAGGEDDPPDDMGINSPVETDDPVPGGPGYYIGSAFEFRPRSSTMDYEFISGSRLRNTSTNATLEFFDAAINLPQGARIVRFILFFRDNNASEDLAASLYSVDYPEGLTSLKAGVASSGASTDWTYLEDTSITAPDVVDNAARAYYIRLTLPVANDLDVTGFRIDYAYQTSLPAVFRNATP